MNPSTDDIYEAIMATPAKNVLVLPNNKNIILAAEQTIPMVKRFRQTNGCHKIPLYSAMIH